MMFLCAYGYAYMHVYMCTCTDVCNSRKAMPAEARMMYLFVLISSTRLAKVDCGSPRTVYVYACMFVCMYVLFVLISSTRLAKVACGSPRTVCMYGYVCIGDKMHAWRIVIRWLEDCVYARVHSYMDRQTDL